jgi:hypothetical protein
VRKIFLCKKRIDMGNTESKSTVGTPGKPPVDASRQINGNEGELRGEDQRVNDVSSPRSFDRPFGICPAIEYLHLKERKIILVPTPSTPGSRTKLSVYLSKLLVAGIKDVVFLVRHEAIL